MPVNSAFSALCSTVPTDEIARRDIQMKFSQPRDTPLLTNEIPERFRIFAQTIRLILFA